MSLYSLLSAIIYLPFTFLALQAHFPQNIEKLTVQLAAGMEKAGSGIRYALPH